MATDHLASKYTCLAWSSKSPFEKKSNKRSKACGMGIIALGTASGKILIWNLATAKVVHTLGAEMKSKCAIQDIVFNSAGTKLYSCSDDKKILEWDVVNGEVLRKLKGSKEGTCKLAISSNDEMLAMAKSSIRICELVAGKKVKSFTSGHSTFVSYLAFTSCNQFLLSSGKDGRFVNLYQCEGEVQEPVRHFGLESSPVYVSSKMEYPKEGEAVCTLGAASEDGVLYVWQQEMGSDVITKPIQPMLATLPAANVFAVDFASSDKLVVAYDSVVSPTFGEFVFTAKDGILSTIDLPTTKVDEEVVVSNNVEKKPKMNEKEHVVPIGKHGMKAANHDLDAATDPNVSDDELEQTLAERVQALQEHFDNETQQIYETDKNQLVQEKKLQDVQAQKWHTSSLVTVLEQALQSSDDKMLEYCLRMTNTDTIDATVQRLPPSRVIPFLTRVVEKFEHRPTRASMLCVWIRSILTNHMSYLMGIPHLVEKLSSLYQTLEARLKVFQSIYRLSGRLELVLAQIESKRSAIQVINTVPQATYQEESTIE